jgi:hypothetical protein
MSPKEILQNRINAINFFQEKLEEGNETVAALALHLVKGSLMLGQETKIHQKLMAIGEELRTSINEAIEDEIAKSN